MISNFRTHLLTLLILVLSLTLLAACDSNGNVKNFVEAEEVASLDLASISLSADAYLINADETAQFTVTGKANDDSSVTDLDSDVHWSTSNNTVATVDDSGLVTALADGVVIVTAKYAYLSASSTLTINTADLVEITVDGDTTVDECKALDLTASGVFSDGSTRNITSGLTWSVSESTVATVEAGTTNDATLLTHKPGIASVSVAKSGVTGSLDVEVADALLELIISPLRADVSVDNTVTYEATGVYLGSETEDITESTWWASTDVDVVDFDTTTAGEATGIAEGSTSIIATCGELSETAVVVVNTVTLTKVEINYGDSSLTLDTGDDGEELTLRATYSDGSVEDVTDDADWSNITTASGYIVVSDDDSSKGELSITGLGTAYIEAEYDGETDTILIVVE